MICIIGPYYLSVFPSCTPLSLADATALTRSGGVLDGENICVNGPGFY